MKRTAQRQLTKDDDEEGDEVEEVGTGFKKADDGILARRPIKGLPRRSNMGGTSAPAPAPVVTEAPAASKFSGFGGFGSGAASSSSFSFSTPAAPPGAPKLSPAVPAVSSSPFMSMTSSNAPSPFQPSLSATASPATKAFASIVSSSAAAEPKSSSTTDGPDPSEVEYYTSLRGINTSFLSAVHKAIESDPFADVAELLERYKSLRVSAKSTFESKTKAVTKPSLLLIEPATKAAEPPKFSMPNPPGGGFAFGGPSKPQSTSSATSSGGSSTSLFGGFTPKLDTSSTSTLGSPFGFIPSGTKADSTESSKSEPPKSAFGPFGAAPTSSTTTPAPPSSSPFSFGGSSSGTPLFGAAPGRPGSTAASTPFGSAPTTAFGSSASTTAFGSAPTASFGSSSATPSLFGASPSSPSLFGSSSTTSAGSLFGKIADREKESDKEKDAEKKSAPTSLFGSGASTPNPFSFSGSGTSTPTDKDNDKDSSAGAAKTPAFSFTPSALSTTSASSGFSFGAPKPAGAGSIGNPVGFGFGSPPKSTSPGLDAPPLKALPFSFGAKPTSAPTSVLALAPPLSDDGAEKHEASSLESTPAPGDGPPPPPMLLAGAGTHDQEGEGEEDEETVHEIKSKVYKLSKGAEGAAHWGDLGVGMLRVKRHRETEARRVLLRNSSTGKITLNFRVHKGMNPTVADKTVSFMGHDEGQPQPFRIRTKTAEQARELKAALEREIEFVKAKSPEA